MDFHNSSPWLQHQPSSQYPPESQNIAHEPSRTISADSWKDQPGSSQPQAVQPSLDLSDFALSDLSDSNLTPIPSSSTAPPITTPAPGTSPQSFYSTFPAYYTPSATFNAIPYSSWPGPAQSSQLPLSNYSSLNGATSTSATSDQPSQTRQSTAASQTIDPTLTTISNPPAQTYTQAPSFSSSQTQPQTASYQFQHSLFVPSPHYFQSSLQRPPQPQGTLSPQSLHSPSTSLIPNASSSTDYSPSNAASKGQDPAMKKALFQAAIRHFLQPNSFTGAGAVQSLVTQIADYGSAEVDAQTRLDILTKIRDNAGNHYFRAWVENSTAIEITREWLKAGFTAKSDSPMVDTVMPLLHIIDRLPLTIESLRVSKLGKIVVKLVKDPPAPAIKDMAANLERKWRQLLDEASTNVVEDTKNKKRKLSDPPPAKAPPPAKKPTAPSATTASNAPSKVVKKEVKPVIPAVKDAKSDSSFFSTPKPKPKLPSFKKAPPSVVKKEPDTNVAQPSSLDPFQEVLKSMKARKESPSTSTPPPTTAPSTTPVPPPAPAVVVKKKKTVTWAPDGQLESIKIIERAVYEGDPVDGIPHVHNLRDLDRGEGAALHAHLFEEALDWADPIPVEIPPDIEVLVRGSSSLEKVTQEEREQTALGALYMSAAHIPDSPSEPAGVISEEMADKDVKVMTAGPEVDATLWSGASMPTNQTVADLVSQLAASSHDVASAMVPVNGQPATFDLKPLGLDPNPFAALQGLSPEHLQLFQQLAQQQPQPQQPQPPQQPQQPLLTTQQGLYDQGQQQQPPYGSHDQNWSAGQYSEYGQGQTDDRDRRYGEGNSKGRGRGRGRGRGKGEDAGFRNNKRKPCSFFAMGRCKYGDQCDFSHEGPGGSLY